MGKKKKTIEEQIEEIRNNIKSEVEHWKDINDNGCSDPTWADGANMNLTRSHILYNQNQLFDLCMEYEIPIPEEFDIPLPPKVPNNYMCPDGIPERIEKMKLWGKELVFEKAIY